MSYLTNFLDISRCPHCYIHKPNLNSLFQEFTTKADNGSNERHWGIYFCAKCGGVVTAFTNSPNTLPSYFPGGITLDQSLPKKVKEYLQQAIGSLSAPSGAVMLCASAVDSMLKEKGYKDGTLYKRIEKAVEDHLLTKEMGEWAHKVRLDSNDQRHADEDAELPTYNEAQQSIEFTKTLSELLFLLPNKIKQGLEIVNKPQDPNAPPSSGGGF
jgi:hypothetical protein